MLMAEKKAPAVYFERQSLQVNRMVASAVFVFDCFCV